MARKAEIDEKELRRLVEVEKWTQKRIGAHFGYHEETIGKRCRELGLKTQRTGPRSGPGHPEWKGGRTKEKHGYILVYQPDHPHARANGKGRKPKYVLEHRLVMEKHLGRYLDPKEVVHHRNGDHSDNRLENLALFASNADHLRHELKGRTPRWTPEGRARILEAVRRPRGSRKRSETDDPETPGYSGRSPESP